MPQRGSAVLATARRVISNGMVIADAKRAAAAVAAASTPVAAPAAPVDGDEESVMAIQKFLDSANAAETAEAKADVKVNILFLLQLLGFFFFFSRRPKNSRRKKATGKRK